MGREIRKVIPNWDHPRQRCEHSPWQGGCDEAKKHGGMCPHPLYDHSYREAADEWRKGFTEWEAGERQKEFADSGTDYEFWDWEGMPPDKDCYRPEWKPEDATWFQVYETVSEGTPVTPPFATKEELVDYLVANGDFWDQRRGDGGWNRENAESFIGCGYAASMVAVRTGDQVEIKMPRDGQF